MNVFVSYARIDNDLNRLAVIRGLVQKLGRAYIDDLDSSSVPDRFSAVRNALVNAAAFVGVHSPNYLTTMWTRLELSQALQRRIPVFALLQDGQIVDQRSPKWPWRAESAALAENPVGWPAEAAASYTRSPAERQQPGALPVGGRSR